MPYTMLESELCFSVATAVFLGTDGPRLLFETTVFGGLLDLYTNRYSTWGKAQAGHKENVEYVKYPPVETAMGEDDDHGRSPYGGRLNPDSKQI